MTKSNYLMAALAGTVSVLALTANASAEDFNIPSGDLRTALNTFAKQARVALVYPVDELKNVQTNGVVGDLSPEDALGRVLRGTGFSAHRTPYGSVAVTLDVQKPSQPVSSRQIDQVAPLRVAAAAASSVETVVVTSSKIKGDIQTVPIAITALSQEQLTSRQIAGGPDLVKEVPNLTFSKTNFTGYNIQIRGIGTQAISVTTDPAVAVALNDMPFIRNHFFEQEFFDVNQVEVLRGPQGTLYGRNATAGVVNVISAKPTDQFEAMLSADWGNFTNRRYEGMVNVPIVDDRLDLRVAGEWTKREGYTINRLTGDNVDGRDLWSSRVTLGWKPSENFQSYLVWEHFSESDDRMRTAKQLCKTDPGPSEVGGIPVISGHTNNQYEPSHYLTLGCIPASLYSPDSFEVPNGNALPYYDGVSGFGPFQANDLVSFDPYASTTQSRNLRVIETQINPIYKAKNDTLELNADYNFSPSLTFSSQTGYNQDSLWSTEDYNRFDTAEGAFQYTTPHPELSHDKPNALGQVTPDPNGLGHCGANAAGECLGLGLGASCIPLQGAYVDTSAPDYEGFNGSPQGNGYQCLPDGVFCDPQLGCSDRLVAQDLSDEKAWQLSQEFRLASHFTGPLNFSVGGNYLHYETEENYYVFINSLTLAAYGWPAAATAPFRPQTLPWNPGPNPGVVPGLSDNSNCLKGGFAIVDPYTPYNLGGSEGGCIYIDPNPLTSLNNQGHNYFLSQNPYVLNSYAAFGEVYYDITHDLKFTGGLRWTDDRKHFTLIPSELVVFGYGYPSTGSVNQQWNQFTGRAALDWTPKLDFTDQTLVYGSFSHGYKAGGANPPGAILLQFSRNDITSPIHPLTFRPEFIDAYELGTKNTLLDGALTLNGDVFYYNYKDYQISEIVDRTSINLNFNATVKGAELETTWEPLAGLKFSFAGGYEDARAASGQSSIDLMDRTAGDPNWMVVKPFVSQASNCILPTYVVEAIIHRYYGDGTPHYIGADGATGYGMAGACGNAYTGDLDPATGVAYTAYPYASATTDPNDLITNYPGFDPSTAPNEGEGIAKNLGGNELPNAPHFTTSLSADYTMPVSEDWAATLHSDFYWQSQSYARIFNDRPYDKIRGYSNVNLALIVTGASGWQVMGYLKNVFDTTAITGDFLNSDDSGLTTNVFLTDPRLYGVRVTKNW